MIEILDATYKRIICMKDSYLKLILFIKDFYVLSHMVIWFQITII